MYILYIWQFGNFDFNCIMFGAPPACFFKGITVILSNSFSVFEILLKNIPSPEVQKYTPLPPPAPPICGPVLIN